MKRTKTLIIMTLSLVFVLSSVVTNACASQTDTQTIESLGNGGWSFNLQANEKISGEVFISHSIKFWITNPDGFIIQNYGTINQTTPYEFTATKAGNYTLEFQSVYFGETQVQASYDVERPSPTIPSIPNSVNATSLTPFFGALITSVLIATVVAVVLGILLFLGIRWLRKRTPKTPT